MVLTLLGKRHKTALLMTLVLMSLPMINSCSRLFPPYTEKSVVFHVAGSPLQGTLILPKLPQSDRADSNRQQDSMPVVIFVHGDGPITYDCYGYYRFYWQRLAEEGIASFSWNKPGIGGSAGHWESQSMEQRADEVIAAIKFLQRQKAFQGQKIGLIGFSQAGWVLPIVAKKSPFPDFMLLVSGAVSWQRQSKYLTKMRLQQKGLSEAQIAEVNNYNMEEFALIKRGGGFDEYRHFRNNRASDFIKKHTYTLGRRRFEFVAKNWNSDIRDTLKEVSSPVLLLFGEEDLNVNAKESATIYKNVLNDSGNNDVTVKVFPEATHSLTKSKYFNTISPGATEMVKMEAVGENIFADGVMDTITDWIKDKTE